MPTANETLIAHLASGKSYEAVAQLTGISKSTILRRMRNSSFRRKVREARADVLERALGHLARAATEAAITLRNLLRGDSPKIKLGAARAILQAECKFRESEDLAADVEDLKEQVAALQRIEKRRESHEYPFRN
jgi:transcriptional regulator with XRE-family HTH domain